MLSLSSVQHGFADEGSRYDQIWNKAVLWRGSEQEVFQEVRLIGREQVDFYFFRSGTKEARGIGNRRTRIGFQSEFLKEFTFGAEFDFNLGNPDPFFNKITDFELRWTPDKAFRLALGRQSTRFTLDGGTSSNFLQTIDRSVIANNVGLLDDSVPGVSIEGDVGRWFYRAGVYSS